ncbi:MULTISPECIES: YopX family protein [Campylobacter]|uniref:YopX family protein n=1 Tax=Campylobacter TaxID=194 RepID=UPI0008755829|nr:MULTISPECIES: YopX family protein [Campylobacter]OEW33795.1 hypothetical protein AJ880_05440 [Campylobacter jejuni]OEW39203.1 hypothetical protein AJ885_09420 [Campylobacter sp. BCW_6464]
MKLRDFDFRIWSELENGYVGYPALAKLNSVLPAKVHYVDKLVPCIKFDERDDNKEMELWTGLYDEHGKKIYENDILKFSFSFYDGTRTQEVIAYANAITYNGLFFTSKHNGFFPRIDDYSYEQLEENFTFSMEIIGNIHENPELLKC